MLTTISPNGDGLRDRAFIHFRLSRPSEVALEIAPTLRAPLPAVYSVRVRLRRGRHTLVWAPPASTSTGSYVSQLTVRAAGKTLRLGARSARGAHGRPRLDAPVIRVQGLDAAFAAAGAAPSSVVHVSVRADAPALRVQFFKLGRPAGRIDVANWAGNLDPMGAETRFDWARWRSRPREVALRLGHWPSGVYFLRLESSDGRTGYAPLVIRPESREPRRIGVVVPTNTWQAYNFYDQDGDGYGDTWYAGWDQRHAVIARPYVSDGVPLPFMRYEWPGFLWLSRNAPGAEYFDDQALERISGETLRKRFKLLVFAGHEEYVTQRAFAAITRYRDLGGHLIFLSANNLYWDVERAGDVLTRTQTWRLRGRPEAALVGAEYRASGHGPRAQGPFRVQGALVLPWLFAGCGLIDGDSFGNFGLEVDSVGSASPTGTVVVAAIPNLFNGVTADMTYYAMPNGAMVFDAGALNFELAALTPPVDCLLRDLYERLSGT